MPAAVLDRLAAQINRSPRPIVLLDGRSGSGKTTLADALARRLGIELLRLDDLYPGWDGLAAGARHLHDEVLSRRTPRWRAWDWQRDAPGEWHLLDPSRPLLIEGCGCLSEANRALATYGIWVELADEEVRRRRALARDGDSYAPHWDGWAAQEAAFISAEDPMGRADAQIDGRSWAILRAGAPC